jgi:hypothetical protein
VRERERWRILMPGLLLHTSGESFWSMARKGLNKTGMVVERGRSKLVSLTFAPPPTIFFSY